MIRFLRRLLRIKPREPTEVGICDLCRFRRGKDADPLRWMCVRYPSHVRAEGRCGEFKRA